MSDIKAIVFDWGGVIADDPGDEFLASLLKRLGATDQQSQEIYETYMRRFMRGELSEAEYWQELSEHYGLVIHDTISEEFMQWKGLEVNDDILALADRAKALGMQTAILSNIIEPTYNALASTGHFDRFDMMVASCKEGYAKPQREIYEITLSKLGLEASQTVFIDDKQRNLDPAAEMGFHVILAQNPAQIIADIGRYLDSN